jgi:DNA-binding CsgD family transcriptional regulator/pimeloyl-ACP methyl ester carboxylesterase
MTMAPPLHYARTTDDVTIAYTTDGRATSTLLWLPPAPFSDVVAQYRIPLLRDAYTRLASRLRLVLYDGRGSGHSQRDVADLSLEADLRDLDAVVADARLTTFALFGYYHSVPLAIAYAARHPARVTRLILFGATARGQDVMSAPETQALLSLIERDWELFVESAAHAWMGWGAGENGRLMAEMFRTASTPAVTRASLDAMAQTDVSADLPNVVAPTLVLQSRNERQVPAALVQGLAESLPNGQIGLLAGNAASLFADEPDADLDLMLGFLTDTPAAERQPPSSPGVDGLTPRELEVLRLVGQGETNAEIGRRLGLSVHTVERHAANLYRKIGARGRADATAYAVRRGIV